MRVAVYGTLKRGFHNHRLLAGCEFLGECDLPGTMYGLHGGFPGVRLDEGSSFRCEVFELDDPKRIELLDGLEGYRIHDPTNSLYIRRTVSTPYGECFIYEWNREPYGEIKQVF